MEEPKECVIRRQTRSQERQGEENCLLIHEGSDENNRDNRTDGRATKKREYNPISERTCNLPSNQGQVRKGEGTYIAIHKGINENNRDMVQMGEQSSSGSTIQYPRERIIRRQTRGQERQGEQT